jgi:hypothetical protein
LKRWDRQLPKETEIRQHVIKMIKIYREKYNRIPKKRQPRPVVMKLLLPKAMERAQRFHYKTQPIQNR